MLLDLNKFFSNNNGVNETEPTTTPNALRNEEGSFLEKDPNISRYKPLRERHATNYYELKKIDDNPLDIHNRRLYLESDNPKFTFNNKINKDEFSNNYNNINKEEYSNNNNNINKDVYSNKNNNKDPYNFPVVDLEAVNWDYEDTNKPFKWGEVVIREAIGKQNQTKSNSKSYNLPTSTTTITTTVRRVSTTNRKVIPEPTTQPFYKFDLMKVNHENVDLVGELPSKHLWGDIHQKFGESTSAPKTPSTTSYKTSTSRGRREKRRKRKVKKNLWTPSKSELSVEEVDTDNAKKIFNPLDDDWKSIFRSTTGMPVIDNSVFETATTSSKDETTKSTERRRHEPVDKNTGFLKRLVSKYCKIEDSLGILQLCNSKSLSKRRKIRKNDSVFHKNKKSYLSQGFHPTKERRQQDFNILNTVSNVFSLILPSQ